MKVPEIPSSDIATGSKRHQRRQEIPVGAKQQSRIEVDFEERIPSRRLK